MKKLVSIILCAALLLLAACQVTETYQSTVNPPPQPPLPTAPYGEPHFAHGNYYIFLHNTLYSLNMNTPDDEDGYGATEVQPVLVVDYTGERLDDYGEVFEERVEPTPLTLHSNALVPREYFVIQLNNDPDHTLTAGVQGDNSLIFFSSANPNYQNQQWHFVPNDNGTYSIVMRGEPNRILTYFNGFFSLSLPGAFDGYVDIQEATNENDSENDNDNDDEVEENILITEFELTPAQGTSPLRFAQYISYGGNVIMRLPRHILDSAHIDENLLRTWVNDMQAVYESLVRLTSVTPVQTIIIHAYAELGDRPIGHHHGEGVILLSSSFITQQLNLLAQRRASGYQDWSFWVMVEIARIFVDDYWSFDADVFAFLLVTYIMQAHEAMGTPIPGASPQVFSHANIDRVFAQLGESTDASYNSFWATDVLITIQRQLGWQTFYDVFENLRDAHRQLLPPARIAQFEDFIELLSQYDPLERDVFGMFTSADLARFTEHYGG